MRQLSIIIILIVFLIFNTALPGCSALKSTIQYSIPVDYSNLSEIELRQNAEVNYNIVSRLSDGIVNNAVSDTLFLYTLLSKINPENTEYYTRLGILYDKINKDRYAKSYFSRAISTSPQSSEPYYYLGNFYIKRQRYRLALKSYLASYERTTNPSYELLYKIGDIYEKFGDTKKALFYLNKAYAINPNEEIRKIIDAANDMEKTNAEFYR
ncbi:tetratricopeptide repeat protein [bacterium]|nr:tetratricopeptide repeat protein [bacterium]